MDQIVKFKDLTPTRLLKECLPRHSIGYAAFDLAIPAGDEKRAFSCSKMNCWTLSNPSDTSFQSVKALATLIRQQWQPRSKIPEEEA